MIISWPNGRERKMARAFWLLLSTVLLSCSGSEGEPALGSNQTQAVQSVEIDFSYPNNWRAPEATNQAYKMQSGNVPCPLSSDPNYSYVDPMPVIRNLAKKHSVVMINESHSIALHRVFIGELYEDLNKQGYQNFGSELLGDIEWAWLNEPDGFKSNGFPSDLKTGLAYWQDPVFGQVMERVSRLPGNLFSFEDNASSPPVGAQGSVDHREFTQAKNIKEYVDEFTGQKFFIHSGYHHIKERNEGSNIIWMAEYFKRLTSIDPLTISQTDCYGTSPFESGLLGYGLLVDKKGMPVSRNGYDLILSAPRGPYYKERPIWLRDELGRRFVEVPKTIRFDGASDFTLITAWDVNKPAMIPAEDIIYRAPHSNKVLSLRPGKYSVVAEDRDKMVLGNVLIEVD